MVVLRAAAMGQVIRYMRLVTLLAVLPLLAACLPSAGPRTQQVVAQRGEAAPFDVYELDQNVAEVASSRPAASLAGFRTGGGAPNLVIGVGDLVAVTIYEAASGGLFSGDTGAIGGAKNVTLPPQPVSRAGTISVPYAGEVRAAGLTPSAVQENIEAALRDKAIEPQVMVTLTENPSAFVTVAGDVGSPGRIPLNLDGDRVLDVIAAAGGSRAPAYDSFVRVTRGSESVEVNLARIVEEPAQNIYLRPDDQIYVTTDPQMFIAFGATTQNSSFPFQSDRLTLAEAMGRAGGLLDSRADATGVFVFRYEDEDLYHAMGGKRSGGPAGVPVVYRLDLKQPSSYFAAQRFLMRDSDIIYVSNAPATDLQKFIGILTGGLGSAATAAALQANIN
jgi:polysaccharide biosynthesis/export protein